MEPTDLFGAAFAQDATTITISKAALSPFGLTPSATNTQEAIIGSLLKLWHSVATRARWDTNAGSHIFVDREALSVTSRTIGANTSTFPTFPYQISVAVPADDFDPDLI